jgi:hypothetical protein
MMPIWAWVVVILTADGQIVLARDADHHIVHWPSQAECEEHITLPLKPDWVAVTFCQHARVLP